MGGGLDAVVRDEVHVHEMVGSPAVRKVGEKFIMDSVLQPY